MNFILWNEDIHDKCVSYLNEHSDTSMFLLNNIDEHGYKRGDHQNSGNFHVMLKDDSIKGIFVLANRGNVLFQLDEDISSKEVVEFIRNNESINVTGVLGENSRAVEMWELFQNSNNKLEETFKSCEILYSLQPLISDFPDIPNSKCFQKEDFNSYLEFTKGFYTDQNLPDNSTDDEYKERFQFKVDHGHIWCLEDSEELVSMCSLNAKYENLAQVGGVYTPSKYRSKGYSKKCMRKLVHDCIKLHGVEKIILFTASDNLPAQKVYESLGFQRIGYYGMYFGELN